jgi:hypothetical protein
MTYENRKKLEELSLNAFGGKNKYLKLYKRGYPTEMTRTKEDGTEEKYRGDKYQTLEEIVVTMHEMIAKKEQEEAVKKERELKVKESQPKTIMQEYEENPKLDVNEVKNETKG